MKKKFLLFFVASVLSGFLGFADLALADCTQARCEAVYASSTCRADGKCVFTNPESGNCARDGNCSALVPSATCERALLALFGKCVFANPPGPIACGPGNPCAAPRMCSVAGAPVSGNNPTGGAGYCLTTSCSATTNCASFFGPGSTCQAGNCTGGGGGGGGAPLSPPPGYAPGCTGRDSIYPVPTPLGPIPPRPPHIAVHSDPNEAGIVPCGISYNPAPNDKTLACPCQLGHLFIMMLRIYTFILWFIATPLAGLLVVIGGVIILVSGVNANLYDLGKRILWGAFWGIILIFASYLIVDIVLRVLGLGGISPIPI